MFALFRQYQYNSLRQKLTPFRRSLLANLTASASRSEVESEEGLGGSRSITTGEGCRQKWVGRLHLSGGTARLNRSWVCVLMANRFSPPLSCTTHWGKEGAASGDGGWQENCSCVCWEMTDPASVWVIRRQINPTLIMTRDEQLMGPKTHQHSGHS